jgi:tetratricopeptide (TPR) repeat protein
VAEFVARVRALPAPLAWVLLLAAAFALHGAFLGNPLVFDDLTLTEPVLRAYGRSWFAFDLRWFPYASLGWTYYLFGESVPWLRAGNVLLHGLAGAALFSLFASLLGAHVAAGASASRVRWAAFTGALIFVVHPVAVYGPGYLVQRSIVMATLCALLALTAFQRGLYSPLTRQRWFVFSAAAYFIAVFCKEHAVMLPLVAAGLAWLARGQGFKPREFVWPVVFALFAAALVTLRMRGLVGTPYEPLARAAIARLSESSAAAGALAGDGAWFVSIVNQAGLYFHYLARWLAPWPGWLAIDLRMPFPAGALTWPQPAWVAAWLAWGGAALWLMTRSGRRALAGFAILCPWLLALTEFSTVRVQEPFALYRSYLWMAPFMLLPALGVTALPRRVAGGFAALLIMACAAGAVERLGSLSSELRTWHDAVVKLALPPLPRTPLADRPWRNRGIAHYRLGQYEAAAADFEMALRSNAFDAENWLARGSLHMRLARSAEAAADFNRALSLSPRHAEALLRRCIVRLRLKHMGGALEDCLQARELEPMDANAHVSLGMVYAVDGRVFEASMAYQEALRLAPSLPEAHYQFAVLMAGIGKAAQARPHFARACGSGLQAACARLRESSPR